MIFKDMEFCTFYINNHRFGIDILNVREVNKRLVMTTVPHAPSHILGVMNLRGRIVTVIDLADKLGLSPVIPDKINRIIIVHSQGEYIGLLVARIGHVATVDIEKIEPPPVNIDSILGKYTQGVFKTESGLIGILDVEAVLA